MQRNKRFQPGSMLEQPQWSKSFKDRHVQIYNAEVGQKTLIEPGLRTSTWLNGFLGAKSSRLDPTEYTYKDAALCEFFQGMPRYENRLQELEYNQRSANGDDDDPSDDVHLVVLDDRADENRGTGMMRDWDSYQDSPPKGTAREPGLLTAADLYQRLKKSRVKEGAERRIIFITDMTPLCALALALPCSLINQQVLREFLRSYVSSRTSFVAGMPFKGFALEFHLPYFVLRKRHEVVEDPRGLRRSSHFNPIKDEHTDDCIHEAQTSVLVTGPDEWYWTTYCCIDIYYDKGHGGKETTQQYSSLPVDAPSAGGCIRDEPIWNPREYFLKVLSRRLTQATREWTNVVHGVEIRLRPHEDTIFDKNYSASFDRLIEDKGTKRTQSNMWTVQFLQTFVFALTRTIDAWESFEARDLTYFHDDGFIRPRWKTYIEPMIHSVNELVALRTLLEQKLEMLDSTKNLVINVSALRATQASGEHSQAAVRQGENIRLLTLVTIAYLPLTLVTGVFSMAVMPKGVTLGTYFVVLVVFTAISSTMVWQMDRLIPWLKERSGVLKECHDAFLLFFRA